MAITITVTEEVQILPVAIDTPLRPSRSSAWGDMAHTDERTAKGTHTFG